MDKNTRIAIIFIGGFLWATFLIIIGIIGSRPVGNRVPVTDELQELSSFREIDFSGVGKVTIIQDGSHSVQVTAEDKVRDRMNIYVTDNILHIDYRNNFPFFFGLGSAEPQIEVHVADLYLIHVGGAGSVVSESITSDQAAFTMSGAGSITIDKFSGDDLSVSLPGAGEIKVSGTVNTLDANLAGTGSLKLAKLVAKQATAEVQGAGSIYINATDTLDAKILGAGNIEYVGDPQLKETVLGLGSIRKAQ